MLPFATEEEVSHIENVGKRKQFLSEENQTHPVPEDFLEEEKDLVVSQGTANSCYYGLLYGLLT